MSRKYCLNLCSLGRRAGCAEVYTNLFETFSVRQVFEVGVSSVLEKVSYGKTLFRSKIDYQCQILIIAATAGRFYVWVSVFLEKRQIGVSRGTLNMLVVPKGFHNGFSCLNLSKR